MLVTRRKTTTLAVFLAMGIFFLFAAVAHGQKTMPSEPTGNVIEVTSDERQGGTGLDETTPAVKVADRGDPAVAGPQTEGTAVSDSDDEALDDDEDEAFDETYEETFAVIADPLQPFNRFMFDVNDKLYFYLLKPLAQAYKFVLPEPVRVSVRNVISNLSTPVRLVNCFLQGKFEGAAIEFSRFMVNTTAGILGIFDLAKTYHHLDKQDEDFGQTLGFYGVGDGFYIVWPLLGPSSIRDTVGMAADYFASPHVYINPDRNLMGIVDVNSNIPTVVSGTSLVNETSLSIGKYEEFKESSIDPYISMRNAYIENRKNKIGK